MSRAYPGAPRVAVAMIVFCGAEVLVIERGKPPGEGLFSVPGGGLRLGEPLDQAARRELHEETGLDLAPGPLVEVVERVSRDAAGQIAFHYVILDYAATLPAARRHEARAGSDARSLRWVTRAQLDALPTTEGLAPVIARAASLLGLAW